jgi:hypothetical protein
VKLPLIIAQQISLRLRFTASAVHFVASDLTFFKPVIYVGSNLVVHHLAGKFTDLKESFYEKTFVLYI